MFSFSFFVLLFPVDILPDRCYNALRLNDFVTEKEKTKWPFHRQARIFFGKETVGRILLRIAPPVVPAQLIQALYNVVDSFFVDRYSADALTAVTVIYPLQLIIVALAVGTGVGVNTYMARLFALGGNERAEAAAGTGTVLALSFWILFTALFFSLMHPYVLTSATEPEAIRQAIVYGNIVCVGSIGTLLVGVFSKIHQARGNMRRPMLAQVAGALTNMIFGPLLFFGIGPFPAMGIVGAAYATMLGQFVSAVIVFPPARCGGRWPRAD